MSLVHRDAAGGFEHRLGILLTHDGLVDVAQDCIDADELPDMRFRPHAFTYLAKDDCNPALLRFSYTIGANVIVTIDCLGFVDNMCGLTGECDLAINLEPILLKIGRNLAHRLAQRVGDAGLFLIGRIHLE